jgi:DNA replication licensing factor MCM3
MNQDQVFGERVRTFQEFLNEDYANNFYKQQIGKMVDREENRLIVDLSHLNSFNPQLRDGVLKQPMDFIPAFDEALGEAVKSLGIDPKLQYKVGFSGEFGHHHVSVGELSSKSLGTCLAIEGIVTRCISAHLGSLVRPKVARSVHFCEKTQLFHAKEYKDGYTLANELPTGSVYPKQDEHGNDLCPGNA